MRPHWRYRPERATMRLLTRLVLGRRLHVEGVANVPRTGPVMVVGNHVATVDPPLVGSRITRTDIFAMAKTEAFRTRFARFFCSAGTHFRWYVTPPIELR